MEARFRRGHSLRWRSRWRCVPGTRERAGRPAMRILVLAPQPFFVHRGTPIAVRALLEILAAQGHRLDVIVFAEGENLTIPGCTFIRVPRIPGTLNVPP